MKDTAIYDFVHQHQHSQQHQWNNQQQQQLQPHLQQPTHNPSVYGNHHQQQQVQRTSIGQQQHHIHHQQQQQQQQHLAQYHHNNNNQQQHHFQPENHHNSSSYYQQAAPSTNHLYSNYPTPSNQQQSNSNVQQHGQQSQQHGTSSLTSNAPGTTNAAVTGQQHTSNNTQSASSIDTNWSNAPGSAVAPSLVTQHLVMNEHTQVPGYMTHTGYHTGHDNSTPADHRNHPNVPVTTQSTTAPTNEIQDNTTRNSYGAINPMYNMPMSAATDTYGYNNYNSGFFQASPNNSSHNPQTVGHPSSGHTSNISTFWNHNQPSHHHQTQQQQQQQATIGNHTNNITQRHQPITTTEQTNAIAAGNYVHDPRLYYGRPTAYSLNVQSYLQPQLQSDILTQRIQSDNLSSEQHQNQLLQQNEQLSQISTHQHQSPQNSLPQSSTEVKGQLSSNKETYKSTGAPSLNHQSSSTNDVCLNKSLATNQNNSHQQQTTLSSTVKNSPQHNQKQPTSMKVANNEPIKPPIVNKQTTQINRDKENSKEIVSQTSEERIAVALAKSISRQNAQKLMIEALENPSANYSSNSRITTNKRQQIDNEPQTVIQNKSNHYQQSRTQLSSQPNNLRNNNVEKPKEIETTISSNNKIDEEVKSKSLTKSNSNESKQQSPPSRKSLEEAMDSISLSSPRKTTWASIASQPAKVSQPKSLKSKIASSNSVLSTSAKHHLAAAAAASAVSLETSSIDAKNGINPAIKSSLSSVATSIQVRNSMPPPLSKLPSVAASLKLDLLGKDSIETSKISWPAVNASINLTENKEEPQTKSGQDTSNIGSHTNGQSNSDKTNFDNEDFRPTYRDQMQHNRDPNPYQNRDRAIARELFSTNRNEQRDIYNRDRRDYPRRPNIHLEESRGINGIRPRDDIRFDEQQNNKQERQEPPGIRDQGPVVIKHYGPPHANNRNGFRGNNYNQYSKSFNQNSDFDDRHNYNQFNDKNQQHFNSRPPYHRNENSSQNNKHNDNIMDTNGQNNSLNHKKNLPQPAKIDSTNFNPKIFNLEPIDARYFIIKSYSEDDIHRSIKYSIWTSTNHGNQKLDQAYRQQKQKSKDAPVYLFFSVNASGHFCGMAEMMSTVDFNSSSGVWAQSKWQGEFKVKWIYVKDVPNMALRHVTLENNEDKPVTNSRDTQEVPSEKGKAVLKIIHEYQHATSLFDDFQHYERRQEEERYKKSNNGGQYNDQQQPQHYNFQNRNERGFGPGPLVGGNSSSRPFSKPQRGHF